MKYLWFLTIVFSEKPSLNLYKNFCIFYIKNTDLNIFMKNIIKENSNLNLIISVSSGIFFINLFQIIMDNNTNILLSISINGIDRINKYIPYINTFFFILNKENNKGTNKKKILKMIDEVINDMMYIEYEIIVLDDKYLEYIKNICEKNISINFDQLTNFSIHPLLSYKKSIILDKKNQQFSLKSDLINILISLDVNQHKILFRSLTKRWILIKKTKIQPLRIYLQELKYSLDFLWERNYIYLLPDMYDDKKIYEVLRKKIPSIISEI
ncbi:hypothetical protein AB836_00475 [Rickettsiales bacterium (ex Bugula neritina AB1)]|nr:hypothetical protein AB836_00475 [Rickettsiales bacterium (ex Bugula neritina AB1)]